MDLRVNGATVVQLFSNRIRSWCIKTILQDSTGALALRIQSKFQNDPQPIRVFTDEMLAARFGLALGVPMPRWREVITGAESKFSGDRGRRMLLLARMIEFKRHVNERRRYKVQGQPLP